MHDLTDKGAEEGECNRKILVICCDGTGMLHTLWRGLRFGGNALVVLLLALGLLPLMFGVLCDLVLAPCR